MKSFHRRGEKSFLFRKRSVLELRQLVWLTSLACTKLLTVRIQPNLDTFKSKKTNSNAKFTKFMIIWSLISTNFPVQVFLSSSPHKNWQNFRTKPVMLHWNDHFYKQKQEKKNKSPIFFQFSLMCCLQKTQRKRSFYFFLPIQEKFYL